MKIWSSLSFGLPSSTFADKGRTAAAFLLVGSRLPCTPIVSHEAAHGRHGGILILGAQGIAFPPLGEGTVVIFVFRGAFTSSPLL